MIKGLFETHLNVTNLERSAYFYEHVLELPLAHSEHTEGRKRRFYWIGEQRNQAMLGIWEKASSEVVRQHFAFQVTPEDLKQSVSYLKAKGIETSNFLDDDKGQLYVFGWMPAVSVYFSDPDGHSLEFVAVLPDPPRPGLGMVPWKEWELMHRRTW
ncbi:Metallothiol transferase FosB 2 [compost metagenome]